MPAGRTAIPVTAGDYVYSWGRQLRPETAAPYASFFFDVKNAEAFNTGAEGVTEADLGLKAVDDWTLEVTCEGPRGGFPLKAAYAAAYPAPQWAVEEHGELEWALGDIPLVSNGPFNLDEPGARRQVDDGAQRRLLGR